MDHEVSDDVRRQAKGIMRRRFRSHRAGLPPSAVRARSEAIVERLLARIDTHGAIGSVASFWPMTRRNEVDLRELDATLRARGVRMAYPTIDEARVMTFRWVDDPERDLEDTEMGFAAPPLDRPLCEQVDLVVVPGLAFDARGFRIGYGGGFYDQILPRHCPPAKAWGVAFDLQLAIDVPNTAHDVAVDRIFTDRRELEATR